MSRALVWEHYGGAWHRYGDPMEAGGARALAGLIRDPVSDDDDAHDTRVFELEVRGVIADMDRARFAALKPKTWTTIRGVRVYVTRRVSPVVIEVYDNNEMTYRIVAAPQETP